MVAEPFPGEIGDRLESAGFLEEVGGPGDDLEAGRRAELGLGAAVELEHDFVASADDQQRGGPHQSEAVPGQVRPPAPGDDGRDAPGMIGGGDEGGGSTRAGPEVSERQVGDLACGVGPTVPADDAGEVLAEPLRPLGGRRFAGEER